MATDQVYEDCVRAMMADPEIDGIVASAVPLTPQMRNMPDELDDPNSIARRTIRMFEESTKPMVAVVDCGPPFEDLVATMRSAGVPVFRSADEAIRALGHYMCHRLRLAASCDASKAEKKDQQVAKPTGEKQKKDPKVSAPAGS
jgi:acyl-CoA synthetase (NDP forming)